MSGRISGDGGERLMPAEHESGWLVIHNHALGVVNTLGGVWEQSEGSALELEAESLWRSVELAEVCEAATDPWRFRWSYPILPLRRELARAEVRYDIETACRAIPRIVGFSGYELEELRDAAFNAMNPTRAIQEETPRQLARWHELLWDTTQVDGESEPEYWLSDLRLASARLATGLEVVLGLDPR